MHCMPVAHGTWFPVSSEGLNTLGDFGEGVLGRGGRLLLESGFEPATSGSGVHCFNRLAMPHFTVNVQ